MSKRGIVEVWQSAGVGESGARFECVEDTGLDSKADALAWIKKNGKEGEEYRIVRTYGSVRIRTKTTRTVEVDG